MREDVRVLLALLRQRQRPLPYRSRYHPRLSARLCNGRRFRHHAAAAASAPAAEAMPGLPSVLDLLKNKREGNDSEGKVGADEEHSAPQKLAPKRPQALEKPYEPEHRRGELKLTTMSHSVRICWSSESWCLPATRAE